MKSQETSILVMLRHHQCFLLTFCRVEPEYPDIQSRASMVLLYSILNTEKGAQAPFQCTNMNKKIVLKKSLFIHNVYANCFKYTGLEELFTNCSCPWDNPQAEHTQLLLLYWCISTLGDINLFGSTANTRTCDKAS